MAFSLQIKHHTGTFLQGDVIAIRPYGFQYQEGDCLKEWLLSGRSFESYPFSFAIVYCSDVDMDGSEEEVQSLLEHYTSEEEDIMFKRRKYLSIPEDYENVNRVDLRTTGETTASWKTIKQYIVERE